MINWQDLITTLVGGGLLGMGGLIYNVVRKILTKVEAFATHIIECELRNASHAELHRQSRDETNRRLEMLEGLSHTKGQHAQ